MTTFTIATAKKPAAPAIDVKGAFAAIAAKINGFFDQINTRNALAHLDDRLMEDIGLTPEYVRRNKADFQNGAYVFGDQKGMAFPATK